MKRAVKWTLTASTSVDRRPDRKDQDGRQKSQHRPRKVQWCTSTALFMTNYLKKQNFEK